MRLLAIAILCCGCVNVDVPGELPCSIGGACPPGFVCDELDLVCRPPGGTCGDGTRNVGERCDDGNAMGGDGCRGDCAGRESCLDGLVDVGEGCDDGNMVEGDGCDSNCTESACGNGISAGGELCDDGNVASGDGCRADCGKLEVCGDQVLDTGEVCDDLNILYGDGCRGDCAGLEACGDGLIDMDEACDGQSGCNGRCRFTTCGNDTVEIGELCLRATSVFLSRTGQGNAARESIARDFDGDGDLDLLTLGTTDTFLLRLQRNDGFGGFGPPSGLATPITSGIGAADLDGDGDLDSFGIAGDSRSIAIHLNDGAGFGAAIEIPVFALLGDALLAGDFDADGDVDLIFSFTREVPGPVADEIVEHLLRNRGDATFILETETEASAPILAVGDVDGDQDLDLITSSRIRLNDGAGQFIDGPSLPASGTANCVRDRAVLDDLDSDGDNDLVQGCSTSQGGAVVTLENDGTGVFSNEHLVISTRGIPAVSDLDGDGDLDLVVALDAQVNVFPNDGAGNFGTSLAFAGPSPTSDLEVGDLDGDDAPDLVIDSFFEGHIVFNRGQLQLAAPRRFSGLSGGFLVAADFNRDGHVDLLMGDPLSVYLGDGTGAYVTSFTTITPGFSSAELIDIDGDQDVDLVGFAIENQQAQIRVYVNDGAGRFAASPPSIVSAPGVHPQQSFALADLDGDGRLDVISSTDAPVLSIVRGTATGFGAPTALGFADGEFPFGVGTVLVAAGDVNGDGHLDVVATITTQPRREIITLLNDGAGNLAVTHSVINLRSQGRLALADVDRDGDLDAIIMGFDFPHIPNGGFEVLKNPGDGKFASSQFADTGGQGGGVGTLADVDGDGDLDVVIKAGGSRISIVRNEDGVFGAPYRVDASATFQGVTVADVDDDQAMDLLWIDSTGGCPGCSTLNVLRADP